MHSTNPNPSPTHISASERKKKKSPHLLGLCNLSIIVPLIKNLQKTVYGSLHLTKELLVLDLTVLGLVDIRNRTEKGGLV